MKICYDHGYNLPSPSASLLGEAEAFRVTWSEKVFEASPGRSSRIRHRNALTEGTWKDAVQGLAKCESKAKVIHRPCDSTSGNLNKTSVREKSRSVYLAIG